MRGLCVPRAQRDVLRTSIDSLLTSVEPTVTWMYYEIKYHQVISFSNSASTEEPVYKNIKDNFVIGEAKTRVCSLRSSFYLTT